MCLLVFHSRPGCPEGAKLGRRAAPLGGARRANAARPALLTRFARAPAAKATRQPLARRLQKVHCVSLGKH